MLLKDLIDIPDTVGAQDFVLRLTDSVTEEHAAQMLSEYVITPKLAERFEEALGVVRSALGISVNGAGEHVQGQHQPGRAVYLLGSFGSGKSHFMAVLHRLLTGDTSALARPELASVVSKHQPWMEGKRFLLVPMNMLDSDSLEQRVFDAYMDTVRGLHPDEIDDNPLPVLFDSQEVIREAEGLRGSIGDEAILAALGGQASDSGWGQLQVTWTLESYKRAIAAPPGSDEHKAIANALVDSVFKSRASRRGTAPFQEGLEEMTKHAKRLGYDAIVLFLDELILWLAMNAATPGFVENEIAKLVNLVEGQHLNRPIPIVGFIARQPNLLEHLDKDSVAAKQLNFEQSLSYHEARFQRIELQTTDLPEIVSRRLLRPSSPEAKQKIDQAFKGLLAGESELRSAHLGATENEETFRKCYPFSPALVQTLVAASSILQRDRTALKAMMHLLVKYRDSIQLGELIPVGDLYDVICQGNDAISGAVREHFERARRFYEERLVPLLEAEHGIQKEAVEALDWADPKRVKWRADDRILKTLLLASLVHNVPALQSLTPRSIVLLNYGTIRSVIPGQEYRKVLEKLRQWGAKVPEIALRGTADNPSVSLVLHGIDLDRIIGGGRSYDKHGNRVRCLKELAMEAFNVAVPEVGSSATLNLTWKGTKRRAELIFANVADLPRASLENDEGNWKVIVDYPIDDQPSPGDRDQAKIDEFRKGNAVARTVLWMPQFFNHQGSDDLGQFVILDELLKSTQRFDQASSHLSQVDRNQARALMEGQRDTLRQRVLGYLRAAYGLSREEAGVRGLDGEVNTSEVFVSLDPAFSPRPPATGSLEQGLVSLVEQALEAQYPKAPNWPKTFGRTQVRKVLDVARRAAADSAGRAPLDSEGQRLMRAVAEPLGLGKVGSAFVLDRSWVTELSRDRRKAEIKNPTVGHLRAWMEEPEARGLPQDIQDLLVIVFADQDERGFYRHGSPLEDPGIGSLQAEDELRTIPLPDDATWELGRDRAAEIFGVARPMFRNGANVSSVASNVGKVVREYWERAHQLHEGLEAFTPDDLLKESSRLADARATLKLFEALNVEDAKMLVERLAGFELAGSVSESSLGASFKQAQAVIDALRAAKGRLLFEGLKAKIDDDVHGADARRLLDELCEVVKAPQYLTKLPEPLRRIGDEATRILVESVTAPTPSIPPAAPTATSYPPPASAVVGGKAARDPGGSGGTETLRNSVDAERLFASLGGHLADGQSQVEVQWRVVPRSQS